jgi:hypothetical protein
MATNDKFRLLEEMFAVRDYCKKTNNTSLVQILDEDIRILKKELAQLVAPQLKNVENLVAGDKDAENAALVVCADARPDSIRLDGTIEVPCFKCGKLVLLSPDSPKVPPKSCFACAVIEMDRLNKEDEQDSFGG